MGTCTFPPNLTRPQSAAELAAWCDRWIEHLAQGPNESWAWAWRDVVRFAESFCAESFFDEFQAGAPGTQAGFVRRLKQLGKQCRKRASGRPTRIEDDLAVLAEHDDAVGPGKRFKTDSAFAKFKKMRPDTLCKQLNRARSHLEQLPK